MKTLNSLLTSALMLVVIFAVSCKKDDITPDSAQGLSKQVIGTYGGVLKNSQTNETKPATLIVSSLNDSLISLHCVSGNFDRTINMMLYSDGDSIMMCFNGQDFYNEYGHNLDNHNFCNNKHNGCHSDWENDHHHWYGEQNNMSNAWNNHMNTQHSRGDHHYGWCYPATHSCKYIFKVPNSGSTYFETFTGTIN